MNKQLLILILVILGTPLGCKNDTSAEKELNQVKNDNLSYVTGQPLKVAIIGLTHTHVHWILGREEIGDVEIVGIVEPNQDLAKRYSEQHGYSMDLVYESMEKLYGAVKPEAVLAFNSIYEHLETVEFFAPKEVHIMVEKPLAVSLQHARRMAELVKKNNVQLLTNYETSWYGSNHKAYNLIHSQNRIGPIQRMVFHHGHPGPIEIGCNEEFLEWLINPVLNGGGAIADFGCYGANLATWLLKGKVPKSVTAVTRQFKPKKYPKVDDDATIILDYQDTQVIIQASWNWSHNRKDMELYGKTGYVICKNGEDLEVLEDEEKGPSAFKAESLPKGVHDPFAYLYQVVKHDMKVEPFDVSSLENNLLVIQILKAAKHSAEIGETVVWEEFFKSPKF